jgi:hypothetical protein
MGGQDINSAYLNLQSLQSSFSLLLNQYKTAYASYLNEVNVNPNSAKARQYLSQAQGIQANLDSTYSNIKTALQNANSSYLNSKTDMKTNKGNLTQVYSTLTDEKKKIGKLMAEYNTLDHVQEDSGLKLQSNYIYYRILVVVVIILVILFIKQVVNSSLNTTGIQSGGSSKLVSYNLLFNFAIIILLLCLAYIVQHSSGYILWALLVISFILYKMKIFRKFK